MGRAGALSTLCPARLQQHTHHVGVPLLAAPARAVERREAVLVPVARVEPVCKQRLGHGGPALESSSMHGRIAVLLADGDIRAGGQQRLHSVQLALQHAVHQRRLTSRPYLVHRLASLQRILNLQPRVLSDGGVNVKSCCRRRLQQAQRDEDQRRGGGKAADEQGELHRYRY